MKDLTKVRLTENANQTNKRRNPTHYPVFREQTAKEGRKNKENK